MKSELVTPTHLARKAVVYIRESTPHQIVSNQESLRLQYALRQRARELGWHDADIDVIDADLGLSGASAAQRSGFKELVGRGRAQRSWPYPVDRRDPSRPQLLRLVSAVGYLWSARLPDCRSRWRLRSRQRERTPAPRAEGDDLRA